MLSLRQSMSILRPLFKLQTDDDLHRPNFIFTSDISKKCVSIATKYLLLGDEVADLTDMTRFFDPMLEFNINIELNALLARNKDLRPSDLIKENMVTLAKTNDRHSTGLKNLLMVNHEEGQFRIKPYQVRANEVFIVSLTLKLLDFVICINDDKHDLIIDFLKDENYGMLLLSDEQLIDQIENYVKITLLRELDIQKLEGKKEIVDTVNINHDNYMDDVTEVPMSIHRIAVNNDKSFTFDDDYESSFEELLLLRSNDTRSTANDGNDDYETETILLEHDSILENDDDSATQIGQSVLKTSTQINTIKEEEHEDTFIDDINNLRHNEYCVTIGKFKDSITPDAIQHTLPASPKAQVGPKHNMTLLKSPVQLSEQLLDSPKSLTRQLSSASMSPKHKSVSRRTSTASFSMVNYEDINPDLEYAFRDKSSTVPSFIKQDKKFKFIKVGKVQKFVSLFEEKLDLASNSAPSTRPTSPLKKAPTTTNVSAKYRP